MQASQVNKQSSWIQEFGAERLLRTALRVNAVSSAATGLFGLVFADTTRDLIGVDQLWLIRLIGGGLFLFALSVVAVSRSERQALHAGSGVISLNDFGWVLATGVVIAFGWLSNQGALIMALIAVMVFGFGAVQLVARKAM